MYETEIRICDLAKEIYDMAPIKIIILYPDKDGEVAWDDDYDCTDLTIEEEIEMMKKSQEQFLNTLKRKDLVKSIKYVITHHHHIIVYIEMEREN